MAPTAQLHQESNQTILKPPPEVAVVVIPFPAQGHLNQLLHLSRLLLSYNLPVHYVSTATHIRQASLRLHGGWDPTAVHFHHLTLPPFPCLPPNPNPNAAPSRFPSHLQPLFNAVPHLRRPVAALLASLAAKSRRVVVIYDSMMASVVQDVAAIANAEAYTFHSVSSFAIYLYTSKLIGKSPEVCELFPEDIPSLDGCFSDEFMDLLTTQYGLPPFDSGCLFNTSRALEGAYMDLIDKETTEEGKRNWAIGPLNPVMVAAAGRKSRHVSLEWLDKQEEDSVMYVSFGTTTTMEEEQIKELALGLERSHQKFIWVLRAADKGDVFRGGCDQDLRAELPLGFEERVKGRGMVVRDWAPQLEILAHPSTGGFMSHCGWNSSMEAITMGVPIAAWPMHSDQPRNTTLITQVLKVGIVVKEWKRRREIASAAAVEVAVRKLMASREGGEMRKRAAEVGGAVRRSAEKGGVSRLELDSFMAHITRN